MIFIKFIMVIVLVINGFVQEFYSFRRIEMVFSSLLLPQEPSSDQFLQGFVITSLVNLHDLFLKILVIHSTNS
jgi:hypothetical protein